MYIRAGNGNPSNYDNETTSKIIEDFYKMKTSEFVEKFVDVNLYNCQKEMIDKYFEEKEYKDFR